MKPTITFSGKDIFFTNLDGKHTLSPYYYYEHDHMIVGNQVNRAIDLYPMSISNIYMEKDETKMESFLKTLHLYTIQRFNISNYNIQVESRLKVLHLLIKRSLPNQIVETINNRHIGKLSMEWDNEVQEALSSVIATHLMYTEEVSSYLYPVVKRIIHLRIANHLHELLEHGTTRVDLKVVDERATVQVIRKEVGLDIPALLRLINLYKHPQIKEEKILKALYEMYDDNFKVTFISPFSFGKSTLINGILGENLLKMDIRAETAIVTKVISADANRLYAKYKDNRIDRYTFDSYNELREKLAGLNGVRSDEVPLEVQIYHTLEHLPCVTIIDAPGLNSRHADHNNKALDAFQMSDLVLFLINPAHIGEANFSRQIKEFIDSMNEDESKVYGFVLSKLDLYSDDYELVIKELEIVLKDLDPSYNTNHVFFVSGYFALIGKQLRDDKIQLTDVRKSQGVFVLENDEIISGRSIEKHHARALLQFSQIERLEQFIKERGVGRYDSNQFDLGRREQEAIGHTTRS
ncbi:dynamin family protein [Paenibacillus agricola]|uniref:Dynamin N-terminal domain-containing protein n=1 Tax=Paenibacillus agricola TaxID=2716264 RepID=A0ABX0JGQ6_9BACL|nr:dynamin family protein [Paenibacillus agricola]NHN34396.1 hypothetical protein [Paenibacillus agricola]